MRVRVLRMHNLPADIVSHMKLFKTLHVPSESSTCRRCFPARSISCMESVMSPREISCQKGDHPTKFPQNVEVISNAVSNDNKGDAASPGMSRDRMQDAELALNINQDHTQCNH